MCWCGSMAEQLICNQQVDGSTPFTSSNTGEFPSGQRGQTVNLLHLASVVRIHLPPPTKKTPLRCLFCWCRCVAERHRASPPPDSLDWCALHGHRGGVQDSTPCVESVAPNPLARSTRTGAFLLVQMRGGVPTHRFAVSPRSPESTCEHPNGWFFLV